MSHPRKTTKKKPSKKRAGRPSMGRTANLPRIHPARHAVLVRLAVAHDTTVAGMIETLIDRSASD